MRPSLTTRLGVAALAAALGTLLASSAASAAVIVPSTTKDEIAVNGSGCSLREAIWAANNDSAVQAPGCVAGNGADTIRVPGGVYRLALGGTGEDAALTGDLDISKGVTITRAGTVRVTVDAQGLDRVFDVNATEPVTIDGITIRGGNTNESGAGVNENGAGLFTLQNATVTANTTTNSYGGGLSVQGGVNRLVNVTISGNTAGGDGGGIDIETDTLEVTNSTITGNRADSDGDGGSGGGIHNEGGTTSLRNAIIAGNTVGGPANTPDCDPGKTSLGGNVIGNPVNCGFTPTTGDRVGVDARLNPLRNNGGPTFTHALRPGSPALNGRTSCPVTDQRGVLRSLGGSCDAGAYELVRCGGVIVNVIGTPGGDTLRGTKKADGILGLGGSDELIGKAGPDALCGGPGKDVLAGGAGNDKLFGGPGKDKLFGGKGRDRLAGQGGRDTCVGGKGKDRAKKCEVRKKI